jgi:hypothetical protein
MASNAAAARPCRPRTRCTSSCGPACRRSPHASTSALTTAGCCSDIDVKRRPCFAFLTDFNTDLMSVLPCNNCVRNVVDRKVSMYYGAYTTKHNKEKRALPGQAAADRTRLRGQAGSLVCNFSSASGERRGSAKLSIHCRLCPYNSCSHLSIQK